MNSLRLLAAVLALVLASALASAQSASSILLNQDSPAYGNQVNFTITYPKEAAKKVGRQQMVNPAVDVRCWQTAYVYHEITSAATTRQNGDGTLTSQTGFITLSGPSMDGLFWTGQAASCNAVLYYCYRADGLSCAVLASTAFTVLP